MAINDRKRDAHVAAFCWVGIAVILVYAFLIGNERPQQRDAGPPVAELADPQVFGSSPGKPPWFQYRATAIRVIDGDTIQMHVDRGHDDYSIRVVRLLGIDCPERSASGGPEATRFTTEWVAKGPLILRSDLEDSFGRWLGIVKRANGDDLAEALKAAGHIKK